MPAASACPFCGAALSRGMSSCPQCDLPLLPDAGSRPALFDGAELFEDQIAADAGFEAEEQLLPVGMLSPTRRPRPEYTRGPLRCVVVALNQAEADMLEDMLAAEGIPSVVRRIGRADVPDFLAAGRRELLVPESALSAARDLLRVEDVKGEYEPTSPLALGGAVLAGLALIALCVSVIVLLA